MNSKEYEDEHAHIFGTDGSRGFTDSLTEMLEEVIRHRQIFEAFEERWNQLREKVRAEHTTSKQQEDELEDWLTGMGADELRTLIRKISALEIKKIRGQASNQNSTDYDEHIENMQLEAQANKKNPLLVSTFDE